ncbi:MAG: hypothetical protein B6242_08450 [Anaerolineaceae bacterium 4572_78]|nr:MAG: hypothetical protein B6242_08450 [Anaerolineaceae bacterium 4572_78]
MPQIFGDFIEPDDNLEFLIIRFSPYAVPGQSRWDNNSLSADFMADYWAPFFSEDMHALHNKQSEAQNIISYIANELIENGVKYGHEHTKQEIVISSYLSCNQVRFYLTNTIDQKTVLYFQREIKKLLTEDTVELQMRQIQKTGGRTSSGLGFLTMINHYQAQLAWKFETIQTKPEIIEVTTMVVVSM